MPSDVEKLINERRYLHQVEERVFPMMIPARITPSITAITLRLKSQSRIDAAKVPVQAPLFLEAEFPQK